MQGDVKKVERRLPCLLDLLQPEGREHKRDSEMEFCVSCVAAEPIYQECKKWDENRQEDHGYKAMVAENREDKRVEGPWNPPTIGPHHGHISKPPEHHPTCRRHEGAADY